MRISDGLSSGMHGADAKIIEDPDGGENPNATGQASGRAKVSSNNFGVGQGVERKCNVCGSGTISGKIAAEEEERGNTKTPRNIAIRIQTIRKHHIPTPNHTYADQKPYRNVAALTTPKHLSANQKRTRTSLP